MFCVFH